MTRAYLAKLGGGGGKVKLGLEGDQCFIFPWPSRIEVEDAKSRGNVGVLFIWQFGAAFAPRGIFPGHFRLGLHFQERRAISSHSTSSTQDRLGCLALDSSSGLQDSEILASAILSDENFQVARKCNLRAFSSKILCRISATMCLYREFKQKSRVVVSIH